LEFVVFLEIFLSLLLVATLAAIAVKYVKVPYTIILVLIGLIIAGFSGRLGWDIEIGEFLTEDFIFMIMLPPLLFEGALTMNLEHLKNNLKTIVALAIPGVLVSTFITGSLIHLLIGQFVGLDFMVSLLFGAMISPTDPVSVLALFKRLGAPKRLSTIVEGESLFNDGTGVVIFGIILTMIGSDVATDPGTLLGEGILNFIIVTVSGLSLGGFLGYAAYKFLGKIDDHLIEVTITFILSFGTFLLTHLINEALKHFTGTPYEWVSGVLAVVAAGLIIGNYGTLFSMSASTRVALFTFWDFMTFIINSLLFLLIGISINLGDLICDGLWILIAIAVVVITRALVTYSTSNILNHFKAKLKSRWQHVMFWGGLRGAIPIALILGVLAKEEFPDEAKAIISHLVFGVVLFSLVFQGLTMEPLMKRLGMITKKDKVVEYEMKIGQAIAARAAQYELENMHQCHEISGPVYRKLKRRYERQSEKLSKEIIDFLQSEEVIHDQQKDHATRRALTAMKSAIIDASRRGVISHETAEELLTKFNVDLDELEKKRD
jgi:CPA1 family monovalent cation:H+ antiporter